LDLGGSKEKDLQANKTELAKLKEQASVETDPNKREELNQQIANKEREIKEQEEKEKAENDKKETDKIKKVA
jgi:hypothetical protein